MVEVIKEPAPIHALNVRCDAGAYADEFGEAGEFFAKHLAGWNAIPITARFPITVFIVEDVRDKVGYAVGPLTDYATVDIDGVKDNLASTMMHEISHVCNNWHWHPLSNLMYPDSWKNGSKVRGDQVT
jgi:hypothetical protein